MVLYSFYGSHKVTVHGAVGRCDGNSRTFSPCFTKGSNRHLSAVRATGSAAYVARTPAKYGDAVGNASPRRVQDAVSQPRWLCRGCRADTREVFCVGFTLDFGGACLAIGAHMAWRAAPYRGARTCRRFDADSSGGACLYWTALPARLLPRQRLVLLRLVNWCIPLHVPLASRLKRRHHLRQCQLGAKWPLKFHHEHQ